MRLCKYAVILLAVYSLVVSFLYFRPRKEVRSPEPVQFSIPETIFVPLEGKPIIKEKTIFKTRIDTFYLRDTVYITQEGEFKALVDRQILDVFVLRDTLTFCLKDENYGVFGVKGFLYQFEPVPVWMDIRIKDEGLFYRYSTLKNWAGRIQINAVYTDERTPFKFYGGGGIVFGKSLMLAGSVLFREKYLLSPFLTTAGDIGVSLQIKIK